LFVLATPVAFIRLRPREAILLVFLGGWLLLPFGNFSVVPKGTLAWWVTGLALPGDVMISKAWVAPMAALVGGILFDRKQLGGFRPSFVDLPIVLWCLWPFADAIVLGKSDPAPLAASAYLAVSWGAPWVIGRIWLSDANGQRAVLIGLAVAGCACLPFALLESWRGPFLHDFVYGPHPFRYDGAERYFWHRPLGFFEHGNQFGIWISLCAVAAIWWASKSDRFGKMSGWAAVLVVALALASQSVGAILLGAVIVIAMRFWSNRVARYAMFFVVQLTIAAGAVHVSGLVPVRSFIESAPAGQATLAMIRSTGRGSFAWRVSQDLKTLDGVRAAPMMGNGQWDWWRPFGTRPWGLWMLMAGQYGLLGVALACGSLLIAVGRVLTRRPHPERPTAAIALAMITLAGIGDAVFNSFLFFPTLLAAGAIGATMPERGNAEVLNERT
jgi:hypothetical protein